MKLHLLFVSSLLILFTGCTKEEIVVQEKIVIQEKTYSWIAHPGFRLNDKPVYNSLATNNYLYLYGPAIFAQIDTAQIMDIPAANWHYNFIKQPISKDFFIEVNKPSNYLILKATQHPVADGTHFGLNFSAIDTSFRALALENFSNISEVAAISSENQLLIPVFTREDRYGNPTFYQLGVKLKSYITDYQKVDTTFVRKIILKNTGSYNGEVYGLHSYYGNFFVSCGGTTFLIRADGTFTKILEERARFYFEYDNSLYAAGYKHIYKSEDQGETWTQVYQGISFPGGPVRAFNIGKDAYIYNWDRIAQLQLYPDRITSKELVNDGLEGNQITSVSRFRDRVYVTTISGVFYKPYEEFLTFKENE